MRRGSDDGRRYRRMTVKPRKTHTLFYGTANKCYIEINPRQRWDLLKIDTKHKVKTISRNGITIEIDWDVFGLYFKEIAN